MAKNKTERTQNNTKNSHTQFYFVFFISFSVFHIRLRLGRRFFLLRFFLQPPSPNSIFRHSCVHHVGPTVWFAASWDKKNTHIFYSFLLYKQNHNNSFYIFLYFYESRTNSGVFLPFYYFISMKFFLLLSHFFGKNT